MLLFVVALVLVGLLWLYFYKTRAGIFTRATMQEPEMAEGIGINSVAIGSLAFAIGAGLAGLTGALYAPTQSLVPLMGTTFTAMAFITVVVGGGVNPIVGALASSALLALIATPLTAYFGTFIGRAGLLVAALVIIRFMPHGRVGLHHRFAPAARERVRSGCGGMNSVRSFLGVRQKRPVSTICYVGIRVGRRHPDCVSGLFASRFLLSNMVLFFLFVPMSLGLCLLWGRCGVLSFGQVAFFGIAGYVYGIVTINLGDTAGSHLAGVVRRPCGGRT